MFLCAITCHERTHAEEISSPEGHVVSIRNVSFEYNIPILSRKDRSYNVTKCKYNEKKKLLKLGFVDLNLVMRFQG